MSGTSDCPVTESVLQSVSDPFCGFCYYQLLMLHEEEIR